MKWFSTAVRSSTRIAYLISMYSGFRAVYNCWQSRHQPSPQIARLDGTHLTLEPNIDVIVRVHARQPPGTLRPDDRAGMLSLYLSKPRLSRGLYRILRLTSHFGCGHIEIAFYETNNTVVVYAVRNILKANSLRLGFRIPADRLVLAEEHHEVRAITHMAELIHELGFRTVMASPEACVSLSLDRKLVARDRYAATCEALHRKYRRISKKIDRVRTADLPAKRDLTNSLGDEVIIE